MLAQANFIFVVVFSLLIIASAIGKLLTRKYGEENSTITNLVARINAWWVMTGVLFIAFLFGRIGATILFFLISFIALREFMTVIYRKSCDYYSMVTCFYLLLPIQYYFRFMAFCCCRLWAVLAVIQNNFWRVWLKHNGWR